MRTLQLQSPNLSGADAALWQQFLAGRGVLNSQADGIFGHATDQATRAYQAARSMAGNGIVDSATLTQAAGDGFAGLGTPGMDASVSCASLAPQLPSQGIQFVIRYYSKFSSKAVTRAEALALSQAGLKTVVVYQDVNNAISFFSASLGRQNATAALAQAAAIGQPAASTIYFAADFDPTANEINGPLMDHFRAIGGVFAASSTPYGIGVYGSGLLCGLMRNAGLVKYTWLSQSTGFQEWASFRPDANLVQSAPSRPLLTISIDDDIAQTADFGQFQVS